MVILTVCVDHKSSVVALGEHSTAPLRGNATNIEEFKRIWPDMLDSRPIKCSATGKEYVGLPRPSLAILDGFQYPWFPIIRSTTSSLPIPILSWYVGFSGGIIHMCLSEKYGGINHITLPEFSDKEIELGRPHPPTGEILRLRGLPSMYDWEMYPQMFAGMEGLEEPGTIFHGLHNYAKYVWFTETQDKL
jgi:hypothetical protein